MPRTKIILNPSAGRGYAASVEAKIRERFEALGIDYDLVHTRGPGDAIRLAREALQHDFETVVAVGGDGTTHEVINGLMMESNGHPVGNLACIPAGSGNDFAAMNGMPDDIARACALIAQGDTHVVDVGRIVIDDYPPHYFNNTAGIGFDGLVTKEARRMKRLRGMALYIPAVLRTVFVTLQVMRVRITLDDQVSQMKTLMMTVSNGPREGRTFLVAPHARCDDGLLDLIITDHVSRLTMLRLIPRFMNGSHLTHPAITEYRGKHILIESEDPMPLHLDGEIPCEFAHRIEISIVPGCLRMVGPTTHCQSS